jgi:hypothetical protein
LRDVPVRDTIPIWVIQGNHDAAWFNGGAMKTFVFLFVVIGLALPGTAYTQQSTQQPGGFGLGIIAREPTGVSGKLFLSGSNAIDAAAAWSLSGDNDFHIQADYLYHKYDLITVEKGQLPLFFGVGGRVIFREKQDDRIGFRIPVGLAYHFEGVPFDVFGEIVPILDLAPDTDLDLEGAVGGRFYFGQ